MLDAKLKLEAKLTTIKQEREHLKALMELVEAMTDHAHHRAWTIRRAGDEDVQRLGDQIRARLDAKKPGWDRQRQHARADRRGDWHFGDRIAAKNGASVWA